jgi:hypothetical protein
MNRLSTPLALACYLVSLLGIAMPIFAQPAAPSSDVVFSGRVVDLQGNPRIGKGVTAQVFFLNGGQLTNAFDRADPRFANGAEFSYNPATARFFLPIQEGAIPSGDVSVRLQFVIDGQIISRVDFLSAKSSLTLDVVVPDPKPTPPCMVYGPPCMNWYPVPGSFQSW